MTSWVLAALTVVLGNAATHTRITIAELPGVRDTYAVAWQDVPGVVPATGAMIYSRDRGDDETRYFAVGGGGLFAIVDRGGAHLIRGTAMSIAWIVSDDPAHPLEVVVEPTNVDAPALLAKYAAYENIAAPGEARAAVETAITAHEARVDRACGSHLAVTVEWASFGAANLARAKQAASILEAIETSCSDKDYATAVRALHELHVDYKASGGALRLETASGTLAAHFSDTSWNPRETAASWLKDHL
ncbi:MAG TPA: hypothetical protein VGG28_20525 [Kofleriaceae bacterium]|jgi:hypothetical protein